MLEYVNHKIKDESFVFNICYQNYTYPKISQQQTYITDFFVVLKYVSF